MSEISSKLSLNTGTSEEITRRLAEEELGSLMQEEVALDAQIEATKISIEQKRGSNENTDADLQLLEILKEKRGRTAVAIELSAQKHGYEPSIEMGDNTRNVLIDDVFQKQEEGGDVSMVSNMEHDTISHMTTEKPPENPVDTTSIETGISYKQSPEDPSMKAADSVVYKDLRGNVIPMKPLAGQEPVATAKEMPTASDELGRSFLYDETIMRINKEIGEIKQKAREATTQLRDHTKDAAEPQKTMEWADKRMSELNKERTEHIKNKIKNASIEEIKAIKDAAHDVVMNQNEMYKTEAVEAIQEADKRIKELETVKHAPESGVAEETMGVEKIAPNPYAVEYTPGIKVEEVPTQQEKQSPIIRLPEDKNVVNALRAKLDEYKDRLTKGMREGSYKAPEEFFDTNYKIAVLEKLLLDGSVNTYELSRDLKNIDGHLNTGFFDNACAVIDDYTKTGGKNLQGGTGVAITTEPGAPTPQEIGDEAPGITAPEKETLSPFEKVIAGIKSEDPARAERLLATIGANPEQRERIEKLLGATQIQKEKIETEAKEKGVLDILRGVGERYQQIPLKWKLGIGAALIGGAFATGGAGILGSIFTLGITARRGMVGLGTFVAVESLGRKWVDSSNIWKNEKEMGRKFATLGGVIAGVLAAGGAKVILDYYEALHGEAVPPMKLPNELVTSQETADAKAIREYATAISPEEKADIAKVVGRTTAEMDAQVAAQTTTETTNSITTPQNEYAQKIEAVRGVLKNEAAQTVPLVEASYTVHGGDNLWNIIKEKIPEIQNLDGEGRQSNAIANIIEQIKKDPESFGITSDDVDSLSAGDTLDLDKIHDVLKTTTIPIEDGETAGIIERASGLTDIETSHIIDNNAKIAEWHTAHPDTPLTTDVTDKILNTSTGAETVGAETHTNQFENIRKDMETTEAISMKADAAFRDDIQTMFGSKGFFGYGFLGTNGEKSVDWLDLKGRPVSEIMSKKFVGMPPMGEEGGVQKFGIDSASAVDKLKGYVKLLIEKSGVSPDEGESVEHFTKRSINIAFSKK